MIKRIIEFIYPRYLTCVLCHRELYDEKQKGFCKTCLGSIQFNIGRVCTICGRMLYESVDRCQNCKRLELSIASGVSVVTYDDYIKKLLYNIKYYDKSYLAHTMAVWIVDALVKKDFDCEFDYITSVPLHISKLKDRGFNQAALIAEFVSDMTGVPYYDVLRRRKKTPVLNTLSFMERKEVLKDVFSVSQFVKGNVLLIDDIFTTGHTLNTCSEVLKNAGVTCVVVATFACGE